MSPAGSPAASSPCVLIVDDDAGMRAYMRECLIDLPVEVMDAGDGLQALACLDRRKETSPVVVVADIQMPGMDGFELRLALSADSRWSAVPVLLVTGEAIRTRDGPALRKPFNATTLKKAVLQLLGS